MSRTGRLTVSVVVPNLNAGPGFEEMLEKLSAQEKDFDCEVLVVDSGSPDSVPESARRYGAVVHRVTKAKFNYCVTRNFGVRSRAGSTWPSSCRTPCRSTGGGWP